MSQSAEDISTAPEHSGSVQVGFSERSDSASALDEVLGQVQAEDATLTLVFFSPSHDEKTVARVLDARCGPRAVAGTTAGELSRRGFTQDSMVAMSFAGPEVRATVEVVPNLEELALLPLVHLPEQFARRIGRDGQDLDPERHTWLLLADGLSGAEDLFTPFFMQASPDTNLVGGSLADGQRYETTYLTHHGRLYDTAAALVLLEYPHPFELIHENHLEFTDRWVEVTAVSQGGRCLEELDGRPALEAYADSMGCPPEAVTREMLAIHPLGFRFRGRPFVCSVTRHGPGGSFRMGSSVQVGERLNILDPGDIVGQTRQALAEAVERLEARPGTRLQGMLLFNCLLRYEEAHHTGQLDALSEVLSSYPVVGFNSLGEQFGAMHTNHSLTGIVFG